MRARRARLGRWAALLAATSLIALLVPAPTAGGTAALALSAARSSLGLGLASASLGALAGALAAAVAMATGRAFEVLLARAVEVAASTPSLLLVALLASAPIGAPEARLLAALAVARAAHVAHLVLLEARALRDEPFVEAARAMGASPLRVIVVHLGRFLAPCVALSVATGATASVAIEAGLALLGLPGARPGVGSLAAHAVAAGGAGPKLAAILAAAAAMAPAVALAEALRDALEPRPPQGLPTRR